jgi:predicted DNA-binding transcriptional regulator AlpA
MRRQTSNTPAALPDRYLSPTDLATILGIPVQTLYQWRYLRTGPPALKIGRHIRYDPAAVRWWIDQQAGDDPRAA